MLVDKQKFFVDWRKRVQTNVDYFDDCRAIQMDHINAARFIYNKKTHILIEWNAFARQGEHAHYDACSASVQ